ncbi:MAG TPA: RpiB/LacA/LacB family sugar-phosphate isomerase, partial [Gemmataceae bacterium]|nr:RpiB/LacA/LacB family sugar-phosphate isomerase [Gemmataceae bacterium]
MKIVIGSDHRGVEIKRRLLEVIRSMGHEVLDVGAQEAESVDYPDYAHEVGKRVGTGEMDRGILICGTGIGMSMAANKVRGVRAAACQDLLTAEMSRRHN